MLCVYCRTDTINLNEEIGWVKATNASDRTLE
jgi:hypothetical protein